LEELRDSNEITLFHDSFHASPGSELWIDQASQRHYQSREEAHRELGRIADDGIKNAEEALRRGNLEEAERLSGIAISADDRRVEPLAIKAAIRRAQGNRTAERLMAELAASALEERLFTLLVDGYCRATASKDPPEAAPVPISRRPMYKVACLPSAA